MTQRHEILQRLDRGEVVIGDGGMVFLMEKRGYCKLGPATPEATVEHPEAVKQAHREFIHAGSDLVQAFTFYATEDKLHNRGHSAGKDYGCEAINRAACRIAKEVAAENGRTLVVASVSQSPAYLSSRSETATKNVFRQQIKVFVEENIDFLICEYFEHVEEIRWAIETGKEFGLAVGATMCIGPEGDLHGVSAKEVGRQLAQSGADVIGVNCHFGPPQALRTMGLMMEGAKEAGTQVHFMVQPVCYHTPDASKQGFLDLPEFPFALEPRLCTRWDIHSYARKAYEMGIRYIGGCCGFEPYHIRAISEELTQERQGRLGEASQKHEPWGHGLAMHTKPWCRARACREHWENLQPTSGRPYAAALTRNDEWGVTAGDKDLVQQAEETTEQELARMRSKAVNK